MPEPLRPQELRALAIKYSQAIVEGQMSPLEGAKRIWWDVWAVCIQDPEDPLGEVLTPFVGEASQWDDSGGRWRPEIEANIRQLAADFLSTAEKGD
jgi:hypothetical protein